MVRTTAEQLDDQERWKKCPESTGNHGPADKYGKCPWCGRKYTSTVEFGPDGTMVSEELASYKYYWDPDFGNDRHDAY